MDWVYTFCFFLGLIYAVFTMIFSGIFGGGTHADFGGHDLAVDGHDAGGMPDPGHADFVATHEMVHFSPLSPIVIAMFVTAFGGGGIVGMKQLAWPATYHVPLALASGFACSLGLFMVMSWIMEKSQGSTHYRAEEALGMTAQVTVAIPISGMGQIAFDLKGQRHLGSAKSEDGRPITSQALVVITKSVGGTYYVKSQEMPPKAA